MGPCQVALSRQIVQDIAGTGSELPVVTLEPELEQLLQNSMAAGGTANPALEPGLAERLAARLAESAQRQEAAGEPSVLMGAPPLRATNRAGSSTWSPIRKSSRRTG